LGKQYKQIQSGIKSDLVIFILTILLGFITIPIYLVYLSMEEFGLFIAVQSTIALLALADIGMGTYVVKKLSNNDYYEKHFKSFLSTMQIFQYLIGLLLLAIGLAIYPIIANILNANAMYSREVNLLFLLSWLSIVVKTWAGLNQAVLRAKHHLAYINIITFTIFLSTVILNIVFLYLGYGLIGLGASLLITTLIANIVMLVKIKKEHQIIFIIPTTYKKIYLLDGWNYVKKLQLLKISQVSKTSMFSILFTNYAGASILAQYNITNKMPLMFPALMSKLSINFFTRFSSLYEQRKINVLRKEYEQLFIFGIKSTIFILLSLLLLNKSFISVWVGEGIFIGNYIFIIMLLNIAVLLLISFTGLIIQISGEFYKMPIMSILEIILLWISTYIFYKYLGTIGIVFALLFSSLPTMVYSLYVVKIILNLNYSKLLVKHLTSILLMIFSIVSVYFFVTLIISNIIIKLILLSIIFIIIFIYIQLRDFNYTFKSFVEKVLK